MEGKAKQSQKGNIKENKYPKEVNKLMKDYNKALNRVKNSEKLNVGDIAESIQMYDVDHFDSSILNELKQTYETLASTESYHAATIVLTNIKSSIIPPTYLTAFTKECIDRIWVDPDAATNTKKQINKFKLSDLDESDDLILTDRDLDDFNYMNSVEDDGFEREEYHRSHRLDNVQTTMQHTQITPSDHSIPNKSSNIDPSTSSLKLVQRQISNDIPPDQFSKLHKDIMSQFASMQKNQTHLRGLVIQLQDKITSLQTDVKTIMNIIPQIAPMHESSLKKVYKYK